MPNLLASANSPYLQQHAHNPVDWRPWDESALEKARREDKPIFLSIGYAACHWCHVMAHESFEDPEIAVILNDNFINIKVDREERPDLDSIYMNAVVAMTGQGGWPMSVFLSSDAKPFYGGTYFPPTRRNNIPSFKEVILTISRLWKEDREKLLKSGEEITQNLKASQSINFNTDQLLNQEIIDQSVFRLAQGYDWRNGGWGQAPKFPQPMTIEFLLRRASQQDRLAIDLAVNALDAMARGGMYDVVGGGFARYSTDNEWLVPHFEKMLYDNALLSRCYLYAHLVTGEEYYLEVCRTTLEFVQREMSHPSGGFYSSLDADSEGKEGKYYVWTYDELAAHIDQTILDLPPVNQANWKDIFFAAYGISREGNFEGENILQRALNDLELSERFKVDQAEIWQGLAIIRRGLLDKRQERIRPGTDDKVLVAWNAFMLQTFAEAGRYLRDPGYLQVAQKNAAFLLENLYSGDRLQRSWREGKAQHNAFLEDYAALALGLLSLYQTDLNLRWFKIARKLIDKIISDFSDPSGGFFDTPLDHEPLLLRPKDIQDNATPCGNSLAVQAFLQYSALTGSSVHRDLAEQMLASIGPTASRYPTAFAHWLSGYDFSLAKLHEVAILYPTHHSELIDFTDVVWGEFQPNLVLAAAKYPVTEDPPEILQNRELINNSVTVYVCEKFFCRQPVTTPEALKNELLQSTV